MMRRVIVLIVYLFASLSLFADGGRVGFIDEEHFQFVKDDVSVGFSSNVSLLRDTLGVPDIHLEDDTYGWKLTRYEWAGIQLYLLPDERTIIVVSLNDSSFQTNDAIKIGAEKSQVVEKYGIPGSDRNNRLSYYCSFEDETWALIFYYDEMELVESIMMHRLD